MNKYLYLLAATLWISVAACEKSTDNDAEGDDGQNGSTSDVLWHKELAQPINPAIGFNYMPAIDADDNIYVLTNNYSSPGYVLQAFDKTGKSLWEKSESRFSAHRQMPTYYQDKLYLVGTDNDVICHDAATGSVKWSFAMPDSFLYANFHVALCRSQVLVQFAAGTSDYSYLFALNAVNGSVVSTLPFTTERASVQMAAQGNKLYLTYDKLYAVSVGTSGMTLDWEKYLPGNDAENGSYNINNLNPLAISPNGNITFSVDIERNPFTRYMVSYSSGGTLLWQNDEVAERHVMADDANNIYVGERKLYQFNGATGKQNWKVSPPSETMGMGNSVDAVCLGNNGVMYCGDVYGLYGFDKSGQHQFQMFPEAIAGDMTPLTHATLLSNGNIIVMGMGPDDVTENGVIYCIKGSTGGVKTGCWAKWGGNAANTYCIP